jgi:hypothetical protein
MFFYIGLQLFAASAGQLAGSLLVPAADETGSQFFAALLATSQVLAYPKLGRFSVLAYHDQFGYWVMGAVILACGSYIVETIRTRSYGHA